MKNQNESTVSTTIVKRFVIRKALIGKNAVLEFTNKKGQQCIYNHDVVYEQLKDKFEPMIYRYSYVTYQP